MYRLIKTVWRISFNLFNVKFLEVSSDRVGDFRKLWKFPVVIWAILDFWEKRMLYRVPYNVQGCRGKNLCLDESRENHVQF
jgi:hypothetical protein